MRPHPFRTAAAVSALVAIVLLAARCGSSTSTSTAPSTVPRCGITLNSNDMSVPATGGSGVISVTATRDCAWSASVEGNWLSVKSGANGQGEGAIEFTAAANPDPQTRTGAVVVNASRAQVTQAAGECVIRLASSSANFPPEGGTARIDVQASSALCTWTATSESPWIQIASAATGRGSGTVTISVAEASGPPRAGSVTIAGQRFSVTQSQGCTYAIDRTTHNATASGGPGTVAVATAPACPWTAASNVPWITITPASGSGPAPVSFSVAPTDGPERTGTAVIAGQLFTVLQSPGCAYQVAPSTHSVGAAGGNATVGINTAGGCGWTAASNVPWITIQGPASGSGPGNLTFAVAATTGPARSGTLTVAGHQVSVTQTQGCTYAISPQSENVPASGGGGKVAVTAGEGCAWTATKTAPWVTIASGASGSGNGEVQYTVAATSGPSRSTTLTIAGQTFTINQGQGCTFRLSPSSINVDDDGGQRSFEVQAGDGCAWTATTPTSWITITSGASGSGNGTVRFTVARNTGPGRSGTITAGGQTFTVNQGQGCAFTLSPSSIDVADEGGQRSFDVQTAGGCGWTANTPSSWITINAGASGSGNGTVRFTVAPNTGPGRTGSITAGGQTFTVRQGQGCSFQLSSSSIDVGVEGGQRSFDVQTAGGCGWTATTATSWIALDSGANGSGPGTVRFTVAPNTGPGRTGSITAAGQTFTVRQGAGCSYALSAERHTAPSEGGTGSVNVTAAGGCEWTARSNAPWITITSGGNGAGNGTVGFSIAPNTEAARSGTMTIAGRTFTVDQAGACSFTINPTQHGLPGSGGTVDVSVSAAAGCVWTAASNVPWILVSAGASGSGNGTVRLTVEPNGGGARTGTVTIAGHVFTIEQGSGCTFSIAPASQSVPAGGGSVTVNVSTQGACTWTATSNASFIRITAGESGSGNGAVQLTVDPNTAAPRSGTATIAGQTFTVNQEGGCAFSVAPETINAPAAGGTVRVDISTSGGCTWTAASNATFIAVSPAGGNGGGNVDVQIAPNTGAPRTGTATIAGRTVTVNQESGCTVAINPTSQGVPATGGTGSVAVTAGLGCQWTAASTAAWIVVTTGASGTGEGTVQFGVDANTTGAPRTGTIVIGTQTFTVNQQ